MDYSRMRAIVIKENNIALMERWKDGRHFFVLPGGKIEDGESGEECVIREVKEELNITIKPKVLVYDLVNLDKQGVYLCEYIDGDICTTDAEEYRPGNLGGKYNPIWIPLSEIQCINLVPTELKNQLLIDIKNADFLRTEKIEIRATKR